MLQLQHLEYAIAIYVVIPKYLKTRLGVDEAIFNVIVDALKNKTELNL